jgi:hypothetical protein
MKNKKKQDKKFYHLEDGVWFYNYYYYFEKYNFDVLNYKFFHYKNPTSPRPDININLIIAKNKYDFSF